MSNKPTRALKGQLSPSGVARAIRDYERRFNEGKSRAPASVGGGHREINDLCYDLAPDFFEYGWGRSFHFSPRIPEESFKESPDRHECNIADALDLRHGMTAADPGCGVGGPLLQIAAYTDARVVGVNCNACQLGRAR